MSQAPMYQLECNIDKQDCATLWPKPPGGPYYIAFTNRSCVRDNRLEGNVGRCGFPGADCSVDNKGQDNCGGGSWSTNRSLCQGGQCKGAAGSLCKDNIDCNWGMQCNVNGSVCGGFNSYLNDNETIDGLNVSSDYCLSGKTFQNKDGYYQCQGGPTMELTIAPIPKPLPIKLIAGFSAGAALAIIILVILCMRKRRQNRPRKMPYMVPEDQGELELE